MNNRAFYYVLAAIIVASGFISEGSVLLTGVTA